MGSTLPKPRKLQDRSLHMRTLKGLLKVVLKVSITALALTIALMKIELNQTKGALLQTNFSWLLAAYVLFNASKIISADRLRRFFKTVGLHLGHGFNMRLYYVGMFYNLFLPGGIGGDGYKIYIINKRCHFSVKAALMATLLDRASGALALLFYIIILSFFIQQIRGHAVMHFFFFLSVALLLPLHYVVIRIFLRQFLPCFASTTALSLIVQALQMGSSACILKSLGVTSHLIEYQTTFLLSSLVAVLPFTIGGLGARDLVFVLSSDFMEFDRNLAVAFSALFFIITAMSSLCGGFLDIKSSATASLANDGT